MGNQESQLYKKSIFEEGGKYIRPIKVKIPQTKDQETIVKNIFGINDPTLLARSYWAKENVEHPLKNQIHKSAQKMKRISQSASRTVSTDKFHPNCQDKQNQQLFSRSNVSQFKHFTDDTPERNLSKATSHSIISKLNKFDHECEEISSKVPQRQNYELRNSKVNTATNSKNSHSRQLSKNRDRSRTQDQSCASNFKKNKNLQISASKISRKDPEAQIKMSRIFGLGNQQNSSFKEDFKIQLVENIDRHTQTPRNFQLQQQNFHQEQQQSIRMQVYEQTFSRHQNQKFHNCTQNLERMSQKTNKSQIQKYQGLNEQSQNDSLMKMIKKVSDISAIDHHQNHSKTVTEIKLNLLNENTSQIFNENLNNQLRIQQRNGLMDQEKTDNKQRSCFKFNLKEIEVQQKENSHKSGVKSNGQGEKIVSQKARTQKLSDQNFYCDNYDKANEIPYSQTDKTFSKDILNLRKNFTENGSLNDKGLKKDFNANDNFYQTEESQELESKENIESFKFQKSKSPKSIASQQLPLNRQRSNLGRIVQTSKAELTNSKSPFKSKKYARISNQNEVKKLQSPAGTHICPTSYSKVSNTSGNELQLIQRIETLEEDLKRMKIKEELQKFESRRYSPVKQERCRKRQASEQNQEQNDDNRFCINEPVKNATFKHRSQYFKLKLK